MTLHSIFLDGVFESRSKYVSSYLSIPHSFKIVQITYVCWVFSPTFVPNCTSRPGRFVAIMHGDEEQVIPGHALTLQKNKPFHNLQQQVNRHIHHRHWSLSLNVLPPISVLAKSVNYRIATAAASETRKTTVGNRLVRSDVVSVGLLRASCVSASLCPCLVL